jgi:hypothetical protein
MDKEHDADGARFVEEFLGLKHSLGQMKWPSRIDFLWVGQLLPLS